MTTGSLKWWFSSPITTASTRSVDEVVSTATEAAGLDALQIELLEWSGVSPMPGETTVAWQVGAPGPEATERTVMETGVEFALTEAANVKRTR